MICLVRMAIFDQGTEAALNLETSCGNENELMSDIFCMQALAGYLNNHEDTDPHFNDEDDPA